MLRFLAGTVTETTLQKYAKAWAEYESHCAREKSGTWSPASILAWRTKLVEAGYSPNTINTALSAIKSVFKAACAAGELDIATYTQARAVANVSVRALRERLRPPKDVLTDQDVERIIAAADTSTLKGLRDKAILCVLATTGVRIEELVSLRLTQWSSEKKLIYVCGKTDKAPRAVPMSDVAQRAVLAWLYARGIRCDWIFTSFAGRSMEVQSKPMTTQGAYEAVVGLAKSVGVHIAPHDFRRYVATRLAQESIVGAQAVLGHASIVTTQRYVKRADLPSVNWLR